MTYHWPGKGKTILLAHGWESNSFRWYRLIETLRQDDFNIIALDAPAHGQSGSSHFNALLYADFINEVVKHYRPNVIIGHSVGGMASAIFRNKYQDDVLEKLVLIGAPSEFVNVFENYTSLLGYNSQLKNSLNELITERFGNTPESFSTAQYLKDVETEGLIIHDKLDKIIAYEEALRIKKTFRNASLISTEGLGHSLHHESVNRHILEFLNS
jgi:pimeloyl-ACP methyl ester carboxylesterase